MPYLFLLKKNLFIIIFNRIKLDHPMCMNDKMKINMVCVQTYTINKVVNIGVFYESNPTRLKKSFSMHTKDIWYVDTKDIR